MRSSRHPMVRPRQAKRHRRHLGSIPQYLPTMQSAEISRNGSSARRPRMTKQMPVSSCSLRAASRSGLRSLKSISLISGLWPPLRSPQSFPHPSPPCHSARTPAARMDRERFEPGGRECLLGLAVTCGEARGEAVTSVAPSVDLISLMDDPVQPATGPTSGLVPAQCRRT